MRIVLPKSSNLPKPTESLDPPANSQFTSEQFESARQIANGVLLRNPEFIEPAVNSESDEKFGIGKLLNVANVGRPKKEQPVDGPWSLYRDGVTSSLLTTFLTCPEKAYLAYHDRLEPSKDNDALEFGNVVHKALEVIYNQFTMQVNAGNTVLALTNHMAAAYTTDRAELIKSNAVNFQQLENRYGTAQVVLEEFFRQFEATLKEKQWVELEKEFDVPYTYEDGVSVRLRGKRDGLYKKDRLGLEDTKTKGQINEDGIFKKLHFDVQIMLYLLSLEIEGRPVEEVTYNVLRRPQIKQKQSESLKDYLQRLREDIKSRPEFYYFHYVVEIDSETQTAYRKEFDRIMVSLRRCVDETAWFRSGNCNNYGMLCPYFSICSEGNKEGFRRKEKVFNELT